MSKEALKGQLKIVYFADGVQKSMTVEMDSLFTDGMLDGKKIMHAALSNEKKGVEIMSPKVINEKGNVISP